MRLHRAKLVYADVHDNRFAEIKWIPLQNPPRRPSNGLLTDEAIRSTWRLGGEHPNHGLMCIYWDNEEPIDGLAPY